MFTNGTSLSPASAWAQILGLAGRVPQGEDLGVARRRGVRRAEAARQAITETAERERRRTGLAAEARALMEDEGYVREARAVASLMEELRGPW
jgi:hypothetical protein